MGKFCHNQEPYCTCINWKDEDFDVEIDHLVHNFEFARLEVTYPELSTTAPMMLCEIGKCRQCGGRICIGAIGSRSNPVGEKLKWLYFIAFERLQQRSPAKPVTTKSFQSLFPTLFHECDQPFVRKWLESPETQSYVRSLLGSGKEALK